MTDTITGPRETVCVCPSVFLCLLQVGDVSKRLNKTTLQSSWLLKVAVLIAEVLERITHWLSSIS